MFGEEIKDFFLEYYLKKIKDFFPTMFGEEIKDFFPTMLQLLCILIIFYHSDN